MNQTVSVLMEGTPAGIEIPKVVEAILSVNGIQNVHDLHVWTITSLIDIAHIGAYAEGPTALVYV